MTNKIVYTPEEAKEKLDNGEATLVDVREAEDYAKDHIPGAVNIPEGLKEMQESMLATMDDMFAA